jgi:hypothetical protein
MDMREARPPKLLRLACSTTPGLPQKLEIEREEDRLLRRHEISRDRVLGELANIAYLDPAECFDERGRLLPLRRIPEGVRRALEVQCKDGVLRGLTMRNKVSALRVLAKCVGLFEKPPRADTRLSVEDLRRLVAEASESDEIEEPLWAGKRLSVEEFRRLAGLNEDESGSGPLNS